MSDPDYNLLRTLHVLLTEQNVARAARRLQLSPSAMSRALARLRESTGDALLVRAGRGLVLTPRALELREQVGPLVQQAETVLRPLQRLDLATLQRTFTLRCSDGFVENFGAALFQRVATEAPGVRLRFVPKPDKDSTGLREGSIDLETAVIGPAMGPEIRTQALFRDRWVAVVREGHLLMGRTLTAQDIAAHPQVSVSRRGITGGPVDEALTALALRRNVVAITSGYVAALALVRGTDLLTCVPDRHTANLRAGLHALPLPFATPELSIALCWHPRMQSDAAHVWLRGVVMGCCGEQ
ncbi:MAG: LysR family transcriptional regulator [Hydrogenophaga sp.]|uniref:LysR family transcriptional regulator n=1 Tax=Hydrogenophaga sp. TaxID=1904254 RepID=UPI001D3AD2D0|nr:LysR family transcriptional regulator [Hydrogenophaga sp.]MBX3610463.1 LysR family transcriptional regulator [Hydrogenophaga sp.]